MKIRPEYVHTLKDLPHEEQMSPGSPLCAGCGALSVLRLMLNAMGEKVVVVNAAGCLTLLATYPFTSLHGSWLYTTMGSASAGAQGIRDALDVLMARGRLPREEDLRVLVVAGDGSTLDIGLSSLSGAIHRGLDFYYLCYDNEAYGNTGFQMSSASPYGSQTATTHPLARHAAGTGQHKKDIFSIWLAHHPPYVATLSSAYPVDLTDKVLRASRVKGPKLFTGLAVCPTGWGYDPREGQHLARLAVETGAWPLKEAMNGHVRHTLIPERRRPVEEYLREQKRFQHLFRPTRQDAALQLIQEEVDAYWQEVISRETFVPGSPA